MELAQRVRDSRLLGCSVLQHRLASLSAHMLLLHILTVSRRNGFNVDSHDGFQPNNPKTSQGVNTRG